MFGLWTRELTSLCSQWFIRIHIDELFLNISSVSTKLKNSLSKQGHLMMKFHLHEYFRMNVLFHSVLQASFALDSHSWQEKQTWRRHLVKSESETHHHPLSLLTHFLYWTFALQNPLFPSCTCHMKHLPLHITPFITSVCIWHLPRILTP